MRKCLPFIGHPSWAFRRRWNWKESLTILVIGLMSSVASMAQTTVSGKVLSVEDNLPLPGVTVLLKGTTIGTTTDTKGEYRLEVPETEGTLVFSFIGYVTEEVAIGSQSNINISLTTDVAELSEVVVIGYGTVKKSDLTGAVGVVDTDALTQRNSVSPVDALQGQVAGVDISNTGGRVGGGFKINVRGVQSIAQGDNGGPLFVVDGIIMEDGIDFLNPQDIERIDILKDASSTAIYGSRGAYGVIIVTTKQGSSVKNSVITYDGYYGVRSLARLPKFMDGDTWMDWRIDAYTSAALVAGNTPNPTAAFNVNSGELQRRLDENDFTDWPSLVLQDGQQQNHWVNLSGRGERNMSYNIGFGYQQEQGNVPGEDYKRYNFKASINHDLRDKWKIGANLNLAFIDFSAGAPDIMRNTFRMNPVLHPYDTDTGELIIQPGKDGIGSSTSQWHINFTSSHNPLVELVVSHQQTQTLNAMGNIFLEFAPLDWLSLKTTFAPRYRTERYGLYEGTNSEGRFNAQPGGEIQTRNNFSYVWDNQVFINKSVNNIHKFSFMGLFSTNLFTNEAMSMRDEFFSMSAKDFYNVGLGSDKANITLEGAYSRETLVSLAGRLNYSLMDKYLVTITNRYDGASVLSDGNKWEFFPSAAVAWKVSSEPFLQNVTLINDLKVRLSYGATGNKIVDPYGTQPFASTLTYYDFGGSLANGILPNGIGNTLLTWERTVEADFGIDFSLWTSRLSGTIDVYNKVSKRQILDRLLPYETGYESVVDNVGEMINKGIEVTLTSVNVSTENLTWTTSVNFAKNRNEITDLYGADQIAWNRGDGYTQDDVLKVGEPWGSYFNYVVDGVWQAGDTDAATYGQTEGQARVKDLDDNGVINEADKRFLGGTLPNWTGGFNTTLQYKGFDFSASLVTRQGVMAFSRFHQEFTNPHDRGRQKLDMDWYMPTNIVGPARESNFYPQVYNAGIYWRNSNVGYYRDASFTKVKNITIGYTLPSTLINKAGINKLRFYVSALNPFVFTDYDGLDPEWATANFTEAGVGNVTILGGVNLAF